MSDEAITGVRTPQKPMPATRLARVVLVLTGLIWMAIGVIGLGWPDELGRTVNLVAIDGLGSLELRAMYGGLSAAIGLLHCFAVMRTKWLQPALFCSAVLLVGLVAGRVASCVIAGVPGPTALFFIGFESAGCTALIVAMWRLKMAERALRKLMRTSPSLTPASAQGAAAEAVLETASDEQGPDAASAGGADPSEQSVKSAPADAPATDIEPA